MKYSDARKLIGTDYLNRRVVSVSRVYEADMWNIRIKWDNGQYIFVALDDEDS